MYRVLWLACVGLTAISSLPAHEPKLQNTMEGHSEGVYSVAWSPDGKTLASGSYDQTIRLWDVATGKTTATLKTRGGDHVTSVAWSPDGKMLASGSYDQTIRLWDVATGKTTATLEGHTECVDFVAWSPDGKSLASVGGGAIKVWDVGTGKNVATIQGNQEWVNSVAWSPDGKSLASGNADGVVKVRSVANGRTIASLDAESGLNVLAITYSPDGKTLASGDGCTIELWDVTSHKSIHTLKGHSCDLVTYGHGNFGGQYIPAVKSVAFSSDGKTLASGSQDKTIKLWDVTSGRSITTLAGHSGAVESVAFSPDGKTLASASDDKAIKLWAVGVAALGTR
jgi:WD40 repeat protein